jgi:hypothetical protein
MIKGVKHLEKLYGKVNIQIVGGGRRQIPEFKFGI